MLFSGYRLWSYISKRVFFLFVVNFWIYCLGMNTEFTTVHVPLNLKFTTWQHVLEKNTKLNFHWNFKFSVITFPIILPAKHSSWTSVIKLFWILNYEPYWCFHVWRQSWYARMVMYYVINVNMSLYDRYFILYTTWMSWL